MSTVQKIPKNGTSPTWMAQGNQALRDGRYNDALDCYTLAIEETPELEAILSINIKMAKQNISEQIQSSSRKKNVLNLKEEEISSNISFNSDKKYILKVEKLDQYELIGWAVDSDLKESVFEIILKINGFKYVSLANNKNRPDLKRHGKSCGLGGYSISFPNGLFDEGENEITFVLPSGEEVSHKIQAKNTCQINKIPYLSCNYPISVVVPVYNALEDLKVCVERLRNFTKCSIRIFFINDASPDPEIKKFLLSVEKENRFVVVHNQTNLGFTKTVNKGLVLAGEDDVVILNSDARVTPRWLEGMQYALSTDKRIATVTPMSDRAGAFSAPNIGNENDLPCGVSEIEYARAFRRRSIGLYPTVPTGNGFCMYIRRACIKAVGKLDERAFPRGYGEENDFCMRARAQGWRHIIDDRTYVFHDRSKSFGGEKDHLVAAGRSVVDQRYPEYKKAIKVFSKSHKIHLSRFKAKQAMADCLKIGGNKPRALFVVATKTGGTPQTNRDLMLALYKKWECWLLHCNASVLTLYKVNSTERDELIRKHNLSEVVDPLSHLSFEYDAVALNWLHEFDFDLVHIRHLAWHSLNLPFIAKNAGAIVLKSFHDFYTICPTVKLLDSDNKFCGGNCSKSISEGKCTSPLWKHADIPELKNNWVFDWRKKFESALKYVDHFITTSNSAKSLILNNFDFLKHDQVSVINHGRDFDSFIEPEERFKKGEKIKILVPGNIDEAKGLEIIISLIELDFDNRLEFHILGNIQQPLTANYFDKIKIHGKYDRSDFLNIVKRIKPHVGAVLSIWDETWCHTLTEIWAAGLPAFVLNFPTVATRTKQFNSGWVLSSMDASHIYDEILIDMSKSYTEKLVGVKNWQKNEGTFKNTKWMASQYSSIYKSLLALDVDF
ncbi:glycosyltransferase [Vreelandella titanicae]|uniref:glycosyltransferase n=1 Tax=Vreelandella titanicae TaxID=664683 RepID=UPI001144296C|nr:glycosyltransferase [Halomonas titanicae]